MYKPLCPSGQRHPRSPRLSCCAMSLTIASPGLATTEQAPTGTKDEQDLAAFGYAQQLRRRLGPYASFAAGFSFVSILTTVTELFGLGYSFGGAAFFWTWP